MCEYLEYISTCLGWKHGIGLPEHENSKFKSDPRQDVRLSLSMMHCPMHIRSVAIVGHLQISLINVNQNRPKCLTPKADANSMCIKEYEKANLLLLYAYPCVHWLYHEGDQLPSLATFTQKKLPILTGQGVGWIPKLFWLCYQKRKVHTLHQKFLSIPYCFVEQMQGFVIKKMLQQHSQHTSNHDTYHCLGPHIPKKLTSNYGVAGKGKIWKMLQLQNDFHLFLTEKYFAALTFSIFSPLHLQHLSQRTECLLFTHILCDFWRKVGGTSECSRQKHPKAIAFSISCTWLISPQT